MRKFRNSFDAGYRIRAKTWGEKQQREEIWRDHDFSILAIARNASPFYCAFCGYKGFRYILVRREDGELFEIGTTCMRYVFDQKTISIVTSKIRKLKPGMRIPLRFEKSKES